MTDDEQKPMNAELRNLLSQAVEAEAPPPLGASEAAWARVAATVGGITPGGGGNEGGPASGGTPASHGGATATSAAGAAAIKGATAFSAARVAIGIALYGAGLASGVVVHRALTSEPGEHGGTIATPASPPRDEPPVAPLLPVETPATVQATPVTEAPDTTARRDTHVQTQTPRDSAEERLLLERAQSALARNDATSAIASLQRHAREFRTGQLAEERDALFVQALVQAERFDEAAAHARQFHASFPRSLFIGVVDAAMRRVPAGSP